MSKKIDYVYNEPGKIKLSHNHIWIGDKTFKCGKCVEINDINCAAVTRQELTRAFNIDKPQEVHHQYFYYFVCCKCRNENIIDDSLFKMISTDIDDTGALSQEDVQKLTEKRFFYKPTYVMP